MRVRVCVCLHWTEYKWAGFVLYIHICMEYKQTKINIIACYWHFTSINDVKMEYNTHTLTNTSIKRGWMKKERRQHQHQADMLHTAYLTYACECICWHTYVHMYIYWTLFAFKCLHKYWINHTTHEHTNGHTLNQWLLYNSRACEHDFIIIPGSFPLLFFLSLDNSIGQHVRLFPPIFPANQPNC